jgi:hypothetical protein
LASYERYFQDLLCETGADHPDLDDVHKARDKAQEVSSSFYLLTSIFFGWIAIGLVSMYRRRPLVTWKKENTIAPLFFFCCDLATPCSVCVGGVLLIRIVLRHTQNKSPTIFFPTHVTLGDMAVGKEERL